MFQNFFFNQFLLENFLKPFYVCLLKTNYLNFPSPENVLLFLSFLMNVFSGHRISNWISFIHSFSLSLFFASTWKILCSFPLAPWLLWEICSRWFVLRPQGLFFSSCYQDILSLVFRSLIMTLTFIHSFSLIHSFSELISLGLFCLGLLPNLGTFQLLFIWVFSILKFIFNWFYKI